MAEPVLKFPPEKGEPDGGAGNNATTQRQGAKGFLTRYRRPLLLVVLPDKPQRIYCLLTQVLPQGFW